MGHVQVVEALADAGANIGWKHPRLGATTLHGAAECGRVGVVWSLVARGGQAAVDARDNDNQTPLHWAAAYGHTAAAQALLEAGADASLADCTDLCRSQAQALQQSATFAWMSLADCTDAVSRMYGRGKTALDLAVSEGSHEVAACIRLASDAARRLCGARQRLAFATALLATATGVMAGLDELPFDMLPLVGEALAALGPPAVRVTFRTTEQAQADLQEPESESEEEDSDDSSVDSSVDSSSSEPLPTVRRDASASEEVGFGSGLAAAISFSMLPSKAQTALETTLLRGGRDP